jgi:hypothetical protein
MPRYICLAARNRQTRQATYLRPDQRCVDASHTRFAVLRKRSPGMLPGETGSKCFLEADMPGVRPRPAASRLRSTRGVDLDGGAKRGRMIVGRRPADRSGGASFTVYFDFPAAFFDSFPSPFALPMVSW